MDRNTANENEAREVIDADFAVGMVRDGFHVFIDNDKPLTYDMVFGSKDPFDFDNETYVLTAPMMEVAQENALESLCSRFDILNDESKYTGDMLLEDYADELYDEHDDESQYRWRDSLSEWENIRVSILSDKTEYLQRFLNDVSLSYPSKAAELREDLSNYKAAYLNRNEVEHIPQQDISHKTTNADLSAKRGESRGNIMEQNTKFEVSTMSKLEGDGPAKAIGTLVVNGEFAVHGVKVVDGKNGLYVAMPSEKRNGEYQDIVFPVTKEARASIDNAVLTAYEKLESSPEKTLKNEIATPEKAVSKVYAQMHSVNSETQTKAAGQMTIDSCFVVTGIKMNEGTNKDRQTKTFVAMPGKPNENGGYDDIAHPITADFHNKVDKAVIASVNNIGRYEYKGVKFAELGENPASSIPLHPKFADKLMAELDKAGIPYQAKCAETVIISVKATDKQTFETAKKDLTAKLNGKDKSQQKQEQTTGTHNKKK